jgi:hypothetical protein
MMANQPPFPGDSIAIEQVAARAPIRAKVAILANAPPPTAPPLYIFYRFFGFTGRSNLYARVSILRADIAEDTMSDFLMLALGGGFFAATMAYVFACERL